MSQLNEGEVRVVDPVTGGEKGSKLQRFSLIPSEFLWELAAHYGRGAKKYADRNWERGYKWSLSEDAFQRHFHAWKQGERYDQETGTHHLIAAAWHLVALYIFDRRQLGTDDITDFTKPKAQTPFLTGMGSLLQPPSTLRPQASGGAGGSMDMEELMAHWNTI